MVGDEVLIKMCERSFPVSVPSFAPPPHLTFSLSRWIHWDRGRDRARRVVDVGLLKRSLGRHHPNGGRIGQYLALHVELRGVAKVGLGLDMDDAVDLLAARNGRLDLEADDQCVGRREGKVSSEWSHLSLGGCSATDIYSSHRTRMYFHPTPPMKFKSRCTDIPAPLPRRERQADPVQVPVVGDDGERLVLDAGDGCRLARYEVIRQRDAHGQAVDDVGMPGIDHVDPHAHLLARPDRGVRRPVLGAREGGYRNGQLGAGLGHGAHYMEGQGRKGEKVAPHGDQEDADTASLWGLGRGGGRRMGGWVMEWVSDGGQSLAHGRATRRVQTSGRLARG